jgi:hypothetical protein
METASLVRGIYHFYRHRGDGSENFTIGQLPIPVSLLSYVTGRNKSGSSLISSPPCPQYRGQQALNFEKSLVEGHSIQPANPFARYLPLSSLWVLLQL